MEKTDAKELIEAMIVYYGDKRFDNPMMGRLYLNAMIDMDLDTAQDAIEKLMSDTKSFNVPQISEIQNTYKKTLRMNLPLKPQYDGTHCYTCMDKGYILRTEYEPGNKMPYEYILHCDCAKGRESEYDASMNNNNPKTYYQTKPISEFYNTSEIRRENIFREKNHVRTPMPDYIKQMCIDMGIKILFKQKEIYDSETGEII